MAATRRDLEALQLGESVLAQIQSGQFRSSSTQRMGADIRRVLTLLATRNISFGTPEVTWATLHELTRLTLLDLAEAMRIHQIRGSSPTTFSRFAPREESPLTVSDVLFASDDPRFSDITLTNANRATARLIGTFAPDFVDVIPAAYRNEAYPPSARAPPAATPHIEVNIPAEEIRAEIRGLGEELGEQVQSGLVAGFDRLTATLPILVRGVMGTNPPTRQYVEERVHTGPEGTHREFVRGLETEPIAAPSPQQVPPLSTSEVPHTGVQRNLFGERSPPPRRAGAPTGLAQQLEDKYRPLFLEDVIGNPANVSILRGAAETGSFQKLYLVTGPPGLGKTSAVVAAIRTYLLNFQTADTGQLFNPNYSPSSPTFGIQPSLLLYNNALDLARAGGPTKFIGDVVRFTRTAGLPGVRKFVVLDDVTKFDKNQQQLLLPLTERYPNTTYFFIANDPDYIPALESRARQLKWQRAEPEEIEARLIHIIQEENLPFADPVAEARKIVSGMGLSREFRQAIIRLASDVAEQQGQRA